MKNLILLFTLAFSFTSAAQVVQGCAVAPVFSFGPEFEILFSDVACVGKGLGHEDYCKCLSASKPALIKNALTTKELREKKQKAFKLEQRQRLEKIYENLNYEVGFQEHKFQMKSSKEAHVGCTPNQMAKEYKEKLCEDGPCPVSIDTSIATGRSTGTNFTVTLPAGYNTGAQNSSSTFEGNAKKTIKTGRLILQQSLLEEAKISPKVYNGVITERAKILKAFLKSNPSALTDADKAEISRLSEGKQFNEANLFRIMSAATDAYNKDAVADPLNDLEEALSLAQFKASDKVIQNKFKTDYEQAPAGACINYENFKVHNSTPTSEDIKKWASLSPEQMEAALNPKDLKSSAFPMKFLQNNPVIAKNVVNEKQRKELAGLLVKFAQNNKGFPDKKLDEDHNLVKNFASFMQNEIKNLNNKNKMMDLLQCDLLAQKFAAASTLEPRELFESSQDKNNLAVLSNNLMACEIRNEGAASGEEEKPTLEQILNANDLFTIFDQKVAYPSPKEDPEYLDFLKMNCPGFDKFEKDHLKANCQWAVLTGKAACNNRALDTNQRKRRIMLEKYYAKNPKAKKLNDVISANTRKMVTEEVFDKADAKKQDKVAVKNYQDNVKPFVKQSMYSTENIFRAPAVGGSSAQTKIAEVVTQAQETYNQRVEQTAIASSEISPVAVASGASKSVEAPSAVAQALNEVAQQTQVSGANPGQYIPPFLDNKPTASRLDNKISSVADAEDALGNLDGAPTEDQKEILSSVKGYLATQDKTSKDMEELNKKIQEYEEQQEQATKVVDNTRVAVRAPASVNAAAPVVSVRAPATSASMSSGSYAPLVPSAPVSSAVRAQQKAATSYEQALNQIHESRVAPASLVVEKNAEFDFIPSPIDQSEMTGGLVIGKSLEPSDKLFAEISSDPKAMSAYLAQNLKDFPYGKVVSIKCKGDGCSRNANQILLKITKGADKKVAVRSFKLLDLNNGLNHATH